MSKFLIEPELARTDLLACAAFLAERIGHVDGHAAAVSDVAMRYAAKGNLDLAAALVDTIDDPHTRDAMLVEVAAKCAELNDDDYGLQLVEAIEEPNLQQQALANIAVRQAARGDLETALETARSLDDPFNTQADIAAQTANAGNLEDAVQILSAIEFPSVRVNGYLQLAALKLKPSIEFVETAQREIENIEYVEEKSSLLIAVAAAYLELGENERAELALTEAQTLSETLEPRFRDEALAQIALAYARGGNFERAEQTLTAVEDLQQTATAHYQIALDQRTNNSLELAAASLEEAWATLQSQPDREVRNSKARFRLWARIAAEFARLTKFERAIELAASNPDEEPRDAALAGIAAVCAENDKPELARQSLNLIADDAARVSALVKMSDAESRTGKTEQAARTLTEAYSLSEEMAQIPARSEVLNDIAARIAASGDPARANEILRENLELIYTIRDESAQSVALANLADACERLGSELDAGEIETLNLIVRRKS